MVGALPMLVQYLHAIAPHIRGEKDTSYWISNSHSPMSKLKHEAQTVLSIASIFAAIVPPLRLLLAAVRT